MSEEVSKVAISLCPLCWRPETEKVEGDLPCVECQEAQKKGFLLIGVDFSRSESTDNAIRTGHRWVVSIEAAKELYNDQAIERGAGLIDIEEAKQLGLPVQTSGYTGPADKVKKTLCGICNQPIHKDELGGIDKEHGFMHEKCKPLKLL